ncbi:MAG: ABC transporter ATP-binding protein [Methylococcales bacterium]
MLELIKQLLSILDKSQRRHFFLLQFAALLSAILEVIGIGAIVSFLGLLTQPELLNKNQWLRKLFEMSDFQTKEQFLIIAGLCLLAVIILKNAFSAFNVWAQLKFVWGNMHILSTRLLKIYLNKPYTYYLLHNSSTLQRNLLSEMNSVTDGIMMQILHLTTQSIMVFFIVVLLFWSDPMLALASISLLGGVYLLIYLLLRRKLTTIGADRVAANSHRYKTLNESFGGIKEIKILGREKYFQDSYASTLRDYINHNISYQLIAQTPKYLIETIALGSVLGIAIYIVAAKQDLMEMIPTATLYALSMYRTLPSLQKIMHAITALRFNRKSLDAITEGLEADRSWSSHLNHNDKKPDPIPFKDHIRLDNISYQYPNTKRFAVKNISCTIKHNTTVGFVGTSGAGKSTVADIILGLLSPTEGNLWIDNTKLTPSNIPSWQSKIGYVPQQIYLSDNSVTNNIAFGIQEKDIDDSAVVQATKIAHIYDFITKELPDGFDTLIGERGVRLSGGQRQRIAIARSLYHNPVSLVMDEATSALDGPTEAFVSESISELSGWKTLIIIAHRLSTVKDCNLIYVFDQGEIIAEGTFDELILNCEKFRNLAQTSQESFE